MLNDKDGRNGRPAKLYSEKPSPVIMTVYTKSPTKWLLVDRETGEIYEGNNLGSWDRLVRDPSITDEEREAHAKRIQH